MHNITVSSNMSESVNSAFLSNNGLQFSKYTQHRHFGQQKSNIQGHLSYDSGGATDVLGTGSLNVACNCTIPEVRGTVNDSLASMVGQYVMGGDFGPVLCSTDWQGNVHRGHAVVNSFKDRTCVSIDGQFGSNKSVNDGLLGPISDQINRTNSNNFGPNLQFVYEDIEFIPIPKRNPYASITPEKLGTFSQCFKPLIGMRECVFHRPLLTDFITMIEENHEAFIKHPLDLGYNSDLPLKLILKPNVAPIYQKPYRIPPHLEMEARDQLKTLEKLGVIREFVSNWSSPAFMVKKS